MPIPPEMAVVTYFHARHGAKTIPVILSADHSGQHTPSSLKME